MKVRFTPESANSLMVFILLALLPCGSVVIKAGQQAKGSQTSDESAASKTVERIINETLKQGEGVVNGVKVWRRVPPSTKNVEEVRRYGDAAVAVLTKYLSTRNERERALAIEFLGLLGGRRIISPLQRVIREDDSPTMRILALRWITQAPFNLVSPIINEAAAGDPDRQVREEAKNILATFTPK